MSSELITDFLHMVANQGKMFSIDDEMRLTTSNDDFLYRYLVYNRVAGLIGAYLKMDKNPGLKKKIDEIVLQHEMTQLVLDWQAKEVLSQFSKHGIFSVMVKGPIIAELYPSMELRPYEDIDLFIEADSIEKAVNCLKKKGYKLLGPEKILKLDAIDDIILRHGELQVGKPGTNVSFDLHWDLANSMSLRRGVRFNLKGMKSDLMPHMIDGIQVHRFSPEFLIIYLISHHTLHHILRGLIWFLDILLVIEKYPGLDWSKIVWLTRKIHLERPVYYYLWSIQRLGFFSFPDETLGRLRPRSLRYRLASKAFSPKMIFRPSSQSIKLRRRLFRESFKLRPHDTKVSVNGN